jgi:osmotically-inducible protein OsmY
MTRDVANPAHGTALSARVLTALALDPRTADEAIEVAHVAGRLYLAGRVASPETKAAAETVARRAAGSAVVINEIEVRPSGEPLLLLPPVPWPQP